MISRTFTVDKLNQASKEALADVKDAKDKYSSLLDEQEQTKSDLRADKTSLETQKADLTSMKAKSDKQQAALSQKIEDNKATVVALQTQYETASKSSRRSSSSQGC